MKHLRAMVLKLFSAHSTRNIRNGENSLGRIVELFWVDSSRSKNVFLNREKTFQSTWQHSELGSELPLCGVNRPCVQVRGSPGNRLRCHRTSWCGTGMGPPSRAPSALWPFLFKSSLPVPAPLLGFVPPTRLLHRWGIWRPGREAQGLA